MTQANKQLGVHGWFAVVALFLFMVINFGDKALLGIAAGPLMDELDISSVQYGVISSSFFMLYSLSSLIVGFLTVRFPTKRILAVLAIVWAIAQGIVMSPLAGFSTLVFTRILLGAGEGPAYGISNHAAMQWFPRHRRGIAAAIVGVGVPAGTMVAAPIVGQLVAGIGWRESFGVLALVSLGWAILWIWKGSEGPYHAESDHKNDEVSPKYRRILTSRTFIGCLIAGVAAYWMVVLLISWVPLYLAQAQGFDPNQVGWAVSLPWAVQVAVNLIVVGWLGTFLIKRGMSSRMARGGISTSALALSGIALLGFVINPHGVLGTILLAAGFGFGACIIPVSQVILGEICSLRQRGAILGIYTAIYSLAGVVAPVLTGAVVQSADNPTTGFALVFAGSGVLFIAAGISGMILINPERDGKKLLNSPGTVPTSG